MNDEKLGGKAWKLYIGNSELMGSGPFCRSATGFFFAFFEQVESVVSGGTMGAVGGVFHFALIGSRYSWIKGRQKAI